MGFTSQGRALKLSNRHKTIGPDGQERRFDYRNLLIGTANTILREFQQNLTRIQSPVLRNDAVQAEIERWIQVAAWDRVSQKKLPPSERAQALTDEIIALQSMPAASLIEALDQTHQRRMEKLQQLRSGKITQASLRESEKEIRSTIQADYQSRRQIKEEERELRKLRRLLQLSQRISRSTIKNLTYPNGRFLPPQYSKEGRQLTQEAWQTALLLRSANENQSAEEQIRSAFPGHMSSGRLALMNLSSQDLRALRIELSALAQRQEIEYTHAIQKRMAAMEELQAKLANDKLSLELHQTARGVEKNSSIANYTAFRQNPALLQHLGIEQTPPTTPEGRQEQIQICEKGRLLHTAKHV